VAVATVLIYPFPFLYTTDFAAGASNLPHHFWTDALSLDENAAAEPDVIMRSIWVHGAYMKVLERDVLLAALELQDELLGPTKNFDPRQPTSMACLGDDPVADLSLKDRDAFHVSHGLTDQSWFFQSPLQYWSCSAEDIKADTDIVSTVNAKRTQHTSVNVTLRHSIVFSGKRFEDRRLVAADALVISLIHLRKSPVGQQWERKAASLAERMGEKWTVIPPDGRNMSSQLYEFQFRPLSLLDSALLTVAYCLTSIYFLPCLSKLRAVKSRFGLIATVLAQTVASVIASFTVCAIFRVDLSRIPSSAYPLVVLAISLENSFRLINAVVMTPAEHHISDRIGEAFGKTAHVAVASRAQNLAVLWALSKITEPGVSAFCTFASFAIVFDFFFLSTFFLSVLSVDVRRTELGDALEKASRRFDKPNSRAQTRQSWMDAMLQDRVGLSTRAAGLVVLVGFVLMAEWHFHDSQSGLRGLGRQGGSSDLTGSSLLIHIHQAGSPVSWLRLQDHETAREVIQVVKPSAHSFIARVYDPLVFVLEGVDRVPPSRERLFPPAVYDFVRHQSASYFAVVLVMVAFVRVFVTYVLWEEIRDAKESGGLEGEPALNVTTLRGGHFLDVAMMAASADGQLVSVGLDRIIRLWDVRSGSARYVTTVPETSDKDLFPILAVAVDDDSNWLAFLSSRAVFLWNAAQQEWGPCVPVDLRGQKAVAFFFGLRRAGCACSLIVVRRDGTMVELFPDVGRSSEYVVSMKPLLCARPLAGNGESSSLTTD
jgi:hypothetical protein